MTAAAHSQPRYCTTNLSHSNENREAIKCFHIDIFGNPFTAKRPFRLCLKTSLPLMPSQHSNCG